MAWVAGLGQDEGEGHGDLHAAGLDLQRHTGRELLAAAADLGKHGERVKKTLFDAVQSVSDTF